MTARLHPDEIRRRKDVEVRTRFESRIAKTDGCWLWTARTDEYGYGAITVRGQELKAHRLSYEFYVGRIPDGLLVLHSCDNPPCVRPDHLRAGTYADNVNDMWSRGRGPARHGVHAGALTRLNDEIVRRMREEYAKGGVTCAQLGKKYGIGYSQASNITSRKSWRHVD